MEKQRTIETFTTVWQGITLSISYEASWLGSIRPADRAIAHLQVESVNPERAPLPITDTGYRSHFLSPSEIENYGGPVAFVLLWIEDEAKSAQWRKFQKERRRREEAGRQLSLFP